MQILLYAKGKNWIVAPSSDSKNRVTMSLSLMEKSAIRDVKVNNLYFWCIKKTACNPFLNFMEDWLTDCYEFLTKRSLIKIEKYLLKLELILLRRNSGQGEV